MLSVVSFYLLLLLLKPSLNYGFKGVMILLLSFPTLLYSGRSSGVHFLNLNPPQKLVVDPISYSVNQRSSWILTFLGMICICLASSGTSSLYEHFAPSK